MSEKPTEELTVKHPESPTTGRELDFDDDEQDTSLLQDKPKDAPAPKRVSFNEEEMPPAQPPRPKNPHAEAEATLIEAFPTVDPKVVKAVLSASGGQVEPAFNALLGMSDPNFVPETPPKPARPAQQPAKPRSQMSQLEQDELYARQLAEHYNTEHYSDSSAFGYGSRGQGDPPMPRRGGPQTGQNLKPNEMYDREHSFFDDDLPVIKQSIQQGFKDTQKTFNKWISDFRKKIDGEDEDEEHTPTLPPRRQNFGPSQSDQLYGIRRSADRGARRSGEHTRYDADPTVLGDDFTQLELHDNEHAQPSSRVNRPLANPDLFKPLPTGPTPQSGPVDEVDALYRQPTPTGASSTANAAKSNPSAPAGTNKKWQPLTSVAPNPEAEDDHDPFSLGDSDEENEKTDEKKTDLRPEDSERLKSGSTAGLEKTKSGSGAGLEEHERSGSLGHKDAVAEELLTGKKS